MDLNNLRKQISNIDDGILTLLAKRKDLILQIGLLKKQGNNEIHDPERESEMKLLRANLATQLGLESHEIDPIFEAILIWSRAIQKEL